MFTGPCHPNILKNDSPKDFTIIDTKSQDPGSGLSIYKASTPDMPWYLIAYSLSTEKPNEQLLLVSIIIVFISIISIVGVLLLIIIIFHCRFSNGGACNQRPLAPRPPPQPLGNQQHINDGPTDSEPHYSTLEEVSTAGVEPFAPGTNDAAAQLLVHPESLKESVSRALDFATPGSLTSYTPSSVASMPFTHSLRQAPNAFVPV